MRIGSWSFNSGTQSLEDGDEVRRLDPVDASVLIHLVHSSPNLVTTEQLLSENWPGVVVGDNVVHRVIARLRKALGDNPRQPSFIETLPRRGYRLIADVEGASELPAMTSAEDTEISEVTLAVLPFTVLEGGDENSYLSEAIADDIISGLVRSVSIRVIARTSSFQFEDQKVDVREIGEKLGASHILLGNVQVAPDEIRVTSQLVLSADATVLWSDRFTSQHDSIFQMQDQITREVLFTINQYFIPRSVRPATNPAARSAYVEGLREFAKLNMEAGRAGLDRALLHDPEYVEVHAQIAASSMGLVWFRYWSLDEMRQAASDHQARALGADPGNQLARSTEAVLKFFVDRSYQEALDDYHEILCERPNDGFVLFPYSTMMRSLNRPELMIEIGKNAVAADPLNPMILRRLAEDLIWIGDLDQAEMQTTRCSEFGIPVAHFSAWIELLRGGPEAAWSVVQDPDARWDSEDRRLLVAAELAFDANDDQAVSEYIEALQPFAGGKRELLPGPGGCRPLRASIELLKGNIEAALDSFEAAFDSSFASIWHCSGVPTDELPMSLARRDRQRYPEYFSHPRYQKILEEKRADESVLKQVEVPNLPF